jgi:hypothetical protein
MLRELTIDEGVTANLDAKHQLRSQLWLAPE